MSRSSDESVVVRAGAPAPPSVATPGQGPDSSEATVTAQAAAVDPRVRFGARIRHAREAGRMSLGEVADRSGVTAGFLSRVERDMTSPSIASLVAICDAVGISLPDLFQTPRTTLIRREERPRLKDLPGTREVLDTLITPPDERHVTVLESVISAGASGGELYTMPSECEVCFVLEGTIEVEVEDQRFVLRRGDALTFGAAVPHSWSAVDEDGVRVLWILAPALPDPQKGLL
jgi:transcriptional regulator with XRE-family HTH domain